ncbi:MFS transporter [uncultured Brevundimonas sp.]|uniref:MFS transporter n=1 Tax=uncultured Brevundimonas sp. TaxID=213418 RepID=UPI0025D89935|nr:MFS transporter [uncultured Brevundimonas sp.]
MTTQIRNRWALLTIVGAGVILITLDNSVLYTALPTLTRDLGASATQALWIINAYPLVMAGLLLGAGTLGDRIGHRRMFVVGLVLFGLASLIAAFSPTAEMLIGARAFLAVGAAAMMPATLALIRVTFVVERERNLAIGVWGALSLVGAALGPVVSGLLLSRFWWGSVFLINVPVVALALIGTPIFAPKVAGDPTKPWDVVSSLQALVALSALVLAIKEAAHVGQSWTVPALALLVAIGASVLFVRRQRRLAFPLIEFSIFRNPAFMAGVLAAAFITFAIGGIQLAATQRFQLVVGFTPLQAGLLVTGVAVGALPTALIGGAFLHRIGLRNLIAGGLAVGAASVLMVSVGVTHGLGWIVGGLLLTGAGLGAAMSVASTAIVGNVPASRAGMASSVEEVSYEFGSLFAVTIIGSLMAYLYTVNVVLPAGAPEEATASMIAALGVAAQDPTGGAALVSAASAAFDGAYATVLHVAAAALAVGAVWTGLLLRRYGAGSASSAHSGSH